MGPLPPALDVWVSSFSQLPLPPPPPLRNLEQVVVFACDPGTVALEMGSMECSYLTTAVKEAVSTQGAALPVRTPGVTMQMMLLPGCPSMLPCLRTKPNI